jgi:VWFA-related protein
MKRTIFVLLVVSGMVVPCQAVKRVTAAQLEQFVTGLHGKPDADQAYQIGDLELTERLSAERTARLSAALPGEKSRQALTAIADASSFQPLPADEIPGTAAPDFAAQRKMMGLVANYVTKTIPQLPNFLANRATTRFEDTPLLQKPGGAIPYEPLHQVGTSSATAWYRDGREFEDAAGTKIKSTAAQGLTTWGEFGPILGIVLLDAAQSKLTWSHWEQGQAGPLAVFSYDVPREKSHYEVVYCCVANPAATVVANMVPFRQVAGYRGEMAVDPTNGSILRISVMASLKPESPVSRADILVEYGSVEIGGKTYICPVKSVSVTTAQMVQQTERYAQPLANMMQPLKTMLNDVRFDQYHMFRADARVLAADTGHGSGLPPLTTQPTEGPVNSSQAGAAAETTPPVPEISAAMAPPAAVVATAEPAPPPPTPPTPEMSVTDSADVPNTPAHLQADAQGSEFTLRTTTRLVDVGLVAYDKKGHPVTDLKQTDFEIYDNGRKADIKYFAQASQIAAPGPATSSGQATSPAVAEVITNRPAPQAATGSGQASPESHSSVLLIDAANLAWGDLSYAREEMLRFLKGLPVGETVGLYILRTYGFEILLEPTADHAQVAAKLTGWMPKAQDLARAQDEEQRNRQHIDWVAHSSDLAYVNGNDGSDPQGSFSGSDTAKSEEHGVDPQLRSMGSNPQRDALLRLQVIARHLAVLPGHKSLVWVSSDNALADWSSQAAGREDKGQKFVDALSMRTREALNEARVSIYPLDASQLEAGVITADLQNRLVQVKLPSPADPPPPPPNPTGRYAAEMHQDTHAIQGTFRDLAEATGGRALRRAGDIAAELNGIAADGRAAYLISFTPDGPADDEYHLITVKLATRHDLTLRYRTGYMYDKEPATLKQRFQRAVWQPRDMNEIALTAVASGSAQARVLKVGVAATDLDMAQTGDPHTGEFWTDRLDIFLIERDDDTLHAKVTGRTLGLRLHPETYQKVLREGIPFGQPLPSKPGAGSLRVIVVDENSGRMGSVTLPAYALPPAS